MEHTEEYLNNLSIEQLESLLPAQSAATNYLIREIIHQKRKKEISNQLLQNGTAQKMVDQMKQHFEQEEDKRNLFDATGGLCE